MNLALVISLACCLAISAAAKSWHPLQGRGNGQCRLVDDVYVVVGTPGIKDKRDVIKQALLSAVDKELTGDGNVRVALYLWAQTTSGVVSQPYGYTTDKQTASSNVESLVAKLGQLTPLDQNPDVHLAQAAAIDYVTPNSRTNVPTTIWVLSDRKGSDKTLEEQMKTKGEQVNVQFTKIAPGPFFFSLVKHFIPRQAQINCLQPNPTLQPQTAEADD